MIQTGNSAAHEGDAVKRRGRNDDMIYEELYAFSPGNILKIGKLFIMLMIEL